MGKKLVHMSLTIGPVFYNSTISLAKKILNKSYAIFVRDQKSYDILNEWNCKAPYQFNSYDIALLQKNDIQKSQGLLAEFGVKSGFIGLSCIYWRFRKAKGPVRQSEYERAQAETLDYIIEKYNKQIVVTPTVVTGNELDDSGIGKRIAKQMMISAVIRMNISHTDIYIVITIFNFSFYHSEFFHNSAKCIFS